MTKYCGNCGNPLDEEEKFCPECGIEVNSFNVSNNSNTGTNNNVSQIQNIQGVDNNLLTVVGFFCLLLSIFPNFGYIPAIIAIIIGIYLYTRPDETFKKYGEYLIILLILLEAIAIIQGIIIVSLISLFL